MEILELHQENINLKFENYILHKIIINNNNKIKDLELSLLQDKAFFSTPHITISLATSISKKLVILRKNNKIFPV